MRSIIFLIILFFLPCCSFSQSIVHLKINKINDLDTMKTEIIIWKLDWENKIVYDRPLYVGIIGNESSIFLYPGDYSVEYRVSDTTYCIYNVHIYSDVSYYRYLINYGYFDHYLPFAIRDRFIIKSVYADF